MIWQVPEIWEIMAAIKLVGSIELIGCYALGIVFLSVILAYNFHKNWLCATWKTFKVILVVNFYGVLFYGFSLLLFFLHPNTF